MTLEYTFDRVAERLVFSTIKWDIINKIDFPSGHVYLQSPFHQYVNNRTEVQTGENIEDRYPSLAIYVTNERNLNALGNIGDYQQGSYETSGATVKIYESTIYNSANVEFLIETLTKNDYMKWKNRLKLWFETVTTGLEIENDTLPDSAGGMSILLMDNKEFTDTEPMQSLFTAKVNYRIYTEYMAYLMFTYEMQGTLGTLDEIDLDNPDEDLLYDMWTGNDPYPPDSTELG